MWLMKNIGKLFHYIQLSNLIETLCSKDFYYYYICKLCISNFH